MAKKRIRQKIRGIVDAIGATGMQSGKGPWTISFTLEAWRDGKGKLHQTKLDVEKPVAARAVDAQMERVPANAILAFEVELEGARATLLKVLGPPKEDDADLVSLKRTLTKPKTVKAAPFGTLKFDRALGWYTAKVKWGGKSVELHLTPASEDELDDALAAARKLFKAQERWTKRVQAYAVKELLDLKNENWLGVRERKVTAAQFKSRMKLESISVDGDGEFTFMHADGGLFRGHSIWIGGDLKQGPNDAAIPG